MGIGNHSLGPAVWCSVLSYQIGGYSASIKGIFGNTINKTSIFSNKKSMIVGRGTGFREIYAYI